MSTTPDINKSSGSGVNETAHGKESAWGPAFWGGLIFVIAAAITAWVAVLEKAFFEVNPQLVPPQVSVGPPLIYFFGAVAVLGAVLFFIPIAKLRLVLKALFFLLYAWGTFVLLALALPVYVAGGIGLAVALAWFFWPRVWLHNLVLMLSLVAAGALFGRMLAPWTVLAMLGVISIYDVVSVRLGYMMWMATKLSELDTLPAFVLPKEMSRWNLSLKGEGFKKVMQGEATEREFSILGGGDIGFPLMVMVSVFFDYGLGKSLLVAGFSLVGLLSAFWMQRAVLKGKPMPALPPIAVASLIGFLLVRYVI